MKTIGGLDNPWGIAINSQGEIYVTEYHLGWITVYSSSGRKAQDKILQEFELPTGIAIDADDNVYVASKNKLQKFNNKGKLVESISFEGSNNGVTVHHNELYVCDSRNNRVLEYDLNLKLIGSFSKAGRQLRGPSDIAFDSNGNMYIADSGNSPLVILDREKQYINSLMGFPSFFSGSGQPQGVHVSGDRVYVSTDLNKIFVFSISGNLFFSHSLVHSFGAKGRELGQFQSPLGIAVDRNGFLYVCDHLNGRIQVF